MIAHSRAYEALRRESQDFLDFVVLVCTAVPGLRTTLAAGTATISPDHFKGVQVSDLPRYIGRYQDQIARACIVTLYSFFEAYVKAVLAEVVTFHGGEEEFVRVAERRARRFLKMPPPDVVAAKRKLQEQAKKSKVEKYKKHSAVLVNAGYRFPTELLASLGVKTLVRRARPKGMRAAEIPLVLEEALNFSLEKTASDRLKAINDLRNAIAHGRPTKSSLKKALAVSGDLRSIAAKVDAHVVEHFFVLE